MRALSWEFGEISSLGTYGVSGMKEISTFEECSDLT